MAFLRPKKPPESPEARAHRRRLIRNMTFEVVPLKNLDDAVATLPSGAEVSVTCSPTKGIEETQRRTEDLVALGHRTIPHLSARQVRDRAHAVELADWCRSLGLRTVFVVGGDAETAGAYRGGLEFLRDFLVADHGLDTVGVPAYPDGHAFLTPQVVRSALHDKQELFAASGVAGYCSTQMCFDPETIAKWLRTERELGLTMPVHLGVPGVVEKTKLLSMGARLGIGDSLKYLRKNAGAVVKMMTSISYDPNDLLVPLSEDLLSLDVAGLHVFTFNQVAATDAWREAGLGCS